VAKATAAPAHRVMADPVAASAVGLLKRWIGRTDTKSKQAIQLTLVLTRLKSQPRFARGLRFHFDQRVRIIAAPSRSMFETALAPVWQTARIILDCAEYGRSLLSSPKARVR
jgi:hypothetical protein